MAAERTEFVDLDFLGHAGVIGTGVITTDAGAWLVDPGPTTALPGLRRALASLGLSLEQVRGLLLTHIHLDHAGASGSIVRDYPDIAVFVHERGAPHMADPSRLLQSAGRLYGSNMERLWGEVAPVPVATMRVLKGGERLDLGSRTIEVAYTPGHASHHVSFFEPRGGVAFVGDTGGVWLGSRIVPPTPPPDIDLAAWSDSIARIREWDAARLYLTHFGGVDRPGPHLDALERELSAFSEMVRDILDRPGTDEDRMRRFVENVGRDLRKAMSEDEANRHELAMPLEQCWLGLARYCRKKATADASAARA